LSNSEPNSVAQPTPQPLAPDHPSEIYGRIKEGVHIAGYTLERAWGGLEKLLADDSWRHVGGGFDDVNTFLSSIRLEDFRVLADQRKRIANRIKELQPTASNRSLSKMLGVGHDTIDRDVGRGANAPSDQKKRNVYSDRDRSAGANAAHAQGGAEAARLLERVNTRAERTEARHTERIAKLTAISNANAPLPKDRRFPLLLADPPWRYEHPPMGGNRVVENHYPTMPLADICSLQVAEIATPDAILFLWVPEPLLFSAGGFILNAWGFAHRTGMVWDKEIIGMGYYVRQQHEHLLIATRGDMPTPLSRNRPSSIIRARRGEHSRKPDEAYELIERMYPDLPRIELFARGPARPGWEVWGNQAGPPAADNAEAAK
jgi:N6-adenosine-specific RNA methylase IME4